VNRLDCVLAAVRAWRKTISPNEFSALSLETSDFDPLSNEEQELAAAIDDLDAFTSKATQPAMAAVVPALPLIPDGGQKCGAYTEGEAICGEPATHHVVREGLHPLTRPICKAHGDRAMADAEEHGDIERYKLTLEPLPPSPANDDGTPNTDRNA
jgi:hypothetical protein